MAKKIKNQKLLNNKNSLSKMPINENIRKINTSKPKSAFGVYSEKLQQAKEKKIQKQKDTRNRVLNKKKQNKVMRQSGFGSKFNKNTKINKFALLDEPGVGQGMNKNKLTHKGTRLQQLKNFNDVHFGQDAQDSADFDNMHAQINFHGFDQTQKDNEINQGRPKTKNQIYKEIIQKSKAHKRQRQKEYEQNFQAAVELDQQFPQFVSKLKFRTSDTKTRQKIQKKDRQYQKLMNQLREDQKVIANKVVDNNKKGQQKVKKKKYEQLKQLMEASDSEEEDVRGWVKGINNSDEEDDEDDEDQKDSINQDGEQQNQQSSQMQDENEQNQDQIDQVQLSSGDEDDEQLSQQQDDLIEEGGKNTKIVIQDEQSSELSKEYVSQQPEQQIQEQDVLMKKKKINKGNINKKNPNNANIAKGGNKNKNQMRTNNTHKDRRRT